jgi:hypothetical protein
MLCLFLCCSLLSFVFCSFVDGFGLTVDLWSRVLCLLLDCALRWVPGFGLCIWDRYPRCLLALSPAIPPFALLSRHRRVFFAASGVSSPSLRHSCSPRFLPAFRAVSSLFLPRLRHLRLIPALMACSCHRRFNIALQALFPLLLPCVRPCYDVTTLPALCFSSLRFILVSAAGSLLVRSLAFAVVLAMIVVFFVVVPATVIFVTVAIHRSPLLFTFRFCPRLRLRFVFIRALSSSRQIVWSFIFVLRLRRSSSFLSIHEELSRGFLSEFRAFCIIAKLYYLGILCILEFGIWTSGFLPTCPRGSSERRREVLSRIPEFRATAREIRGQSPVQV